MFCLAAIALSQAVWTQSPAAVAPAPRNDYRPLEADRGASALWQSLEKLHTRASLMMITAHPDDEDGGMLAYESRGQGVRVALLTLNRGEDGQNAMSNDYWDRLGLVRTNELLEADRYYGVQQYFTRVIDFGFSKTREETLQQWGYDRVLCDVVRVVRMDRPLVMTSVFTGNLTDGHGHHQVAGQMNQEAYKAAGDPNVCPAQIKEGLRPWTPLKVYASVPRFAVSPQGQMYDYATDKWAPIKFFDYVTGEWSDKVPAANVEIAEGALNPLLADSYLQYARAGLGWQKTQNGGIGVPLDGPMDSPYHRYGSRVPAQDQESSFFDGIDISLAGIATLAPGENGFLKQGLAKMDELVAEATQNYSANDPEKIAPELAEGLKLTQSLIQQVQSSDFPGDAKYDVLHELRVKETQFNDAIAESLGITLTAVLAPPHAAAAYFGFSMPPEDITRVVIPGQTFGVDAYAADTGTVPVEIQNISVSTDGPEQDWKIDPVKPASGELGADQRFETTFNVVAPDDAEPTKPYFHRDNVEQPYYDLQEPQYFSQPFTPYPLDAELKFNYQGAQVEIEAEVQTAEHEVGYGSLYDPLIVVPAISVQTEQRRTIIPLDRKSSTLSVTIHNNLSAGAKGTLHLNLPDGWSATPETPEFDLAKEGQEQTVNFTVTPGAITEKPYSITAVAEYNGKQYTSGYVTTGYPGLHPYNQYNPATETLTGVNVKVAPELNIGYVMGTGDSVPQSLESLDVHVHLLSGADISAGDLSKYNEIVLGIRAYAARPELARYNQRLLNYVHNGGVLVVQYQTGEYDHDFGPYPYTLSRAPEKVVDETAAVELLDPQNPLLSWPNKITETDFNGWVEERGHSFLREWDPQYQALTETHDAGQDPQKGGLLYARDGQGAYVYVAYALYRQLEEGVPGAYRLFANLLSLPQAPATTQSGQ
jgi:LmbE family N-acetylglucosaminyl deacetylase